MAVYQIIHRRPKPTRPQWPFDLNADSRQAVGLTGWYPLLPLPYDLSPGGRGALTSTSGTVSQGASGMIGGLTLEVAGAGAMYSDATPVAGRPCTIAAWAMTTSDSTTQDIVSLTANPASGGAERIALQFGGNVAGDPVRALSQTNAGSAAAAVTSRAYSIGVYHHCCAVHAAQNSRAAYIDGGSKGTNTTNNVVTQPVTRVTVAACWLSSALAAQLSGHVAEVRLYSRALTDADVWELYDPATRWDLYWQPSTRSFFDVSAVGRTTKNTRSHPLGIRSGHPWRVVA